MCGICQIERPPDPTMGVRVSLASFMLVPILVFAPTLQYPRYFDKGQMPCPVGGFQHATTHQTWSNRYIFAPERHLDGRTTRHLCKDCNKYFAAWHPDALLHLPVFIQTRLSMVAWFGRKSAIHNTMMDDYTRNASHDTTLSNMSATHNERAVLEHMEVRTAV